MSDDDDDVLEPLDVALDALGEQSRNWHYKHRWDADYFEWMKVGSQVKVVRKSRKAFAERRRAKTEALRQERLAPKPKTSRRGRPPNQRPPLPATNSR